MRLRGYQQSIFEQIIQANTNDLVQLDTGAGKTPIIAQLASYYGQAIIVCHRNILIKQASEKLALCGLEHRILASNQTKKICANNNFLVTGQHFINPRSTIALVSIDTFNSRFKLNKLKNYLNTFKIALVDEAHHLTEDNKWGTLKNAVNCRCVGFTATPIRGDNQPLINDFGGYFERIVQAEGYSENGTERLISEGYLANYLAFYASPLFSNSYNERTELHLLSSPLFIYQEYCKDKQALVILPRITNALQQLELFQKYNIAADIIHSKLPQYQIERVLNAFKYKQLKVLIAVDMINEGFDVPDCEALILARNIKSYGLYRQLCGRVLRPAKDKVALILDATGKNVIRHGLPSDPVDWYKAQSQSKQKALAFCHKCGLFFKINLSHCPNCGHPKDAKLTGVGALDVKYFSGKFQEWKRSVINYQRQQELRQIEEEKRAIEFSTSYLEFTIRFQKNIVGARLAFIFNTLKEVLQEELDCFSYNLFFSCYLNEFEDINFYSKSISNNFNSNKVKECLALYKSKQNDLPKQSSFGYYQAFKR